MKIIFILLIFAFGIFLIFYKSNDLKLTQNQIIFKVGDKNSSYPYSLLKKNEKIFSNLKVKQYIISSQGEIFIFEKAQVDGLYEFNSSPKEVILKLFNAKTINFIFSKNGLEALQVTLKDGRRINLFLLQKDIKELVLLYGFSSKIFTNIIEELTTLKLNIKNATKLEKPLTLWSDKINDIDGVIGSIDH